MRPLDAELARAAPHLAEYVVPRRWFRGKSRPVTGAQITTAIPLDVPQRKAWFAVVRVSFADGGEEDYALPLLAADAAASAEARASRPHLVVCDLPQGCSLLDALGDAQVLEGLLDVAVAAQVRAGDGAELRGRSFDDGPARGAFHPRVLGVEQSNTSVVFGEKYILKVIRKLDDGVSPDLDMGTFLTGAGYDHAPKVAGAIELARGSREPATAAILHRYVPNRGDAWAFFLARLADAAAARGGDPLGADRPLVRLLAARVAEMHLLLASRPDLPAFAPEPIDRVERAQLAGSVRVSLERALRALSSRRGSLPDEAGRALDAVASRTDDFAARLNAFVAARTPVWKTRLHGDLHLGQVLVTGDDFTLIDFEGEPARPLAERKAKRSPLADLAGLLRSFHYAATAAARADAGGDRARFAAWHREASREIVSTYLREARRAPFLALNDDDTLALLDFYLLEKCVYELHYELNNRPDWTAIPLVGLASLIEGKDAG
jgi:maltose alpha-D-glucosyltransferase/alpha-amylase